MQRYLFWSACIVAASLAGCGSSNADDLYKDDKFGTVVNGGSNAGGNVAFGGTVSSGGVTTTTGGTGSTGGTAAAGAGAGSIGGSASTGGLGSGGVAGAAHGGGLSSGGSSLGGAAAKGGASGAAGKGGAGTGGSTGKTCEQLLAALPELLTAAQACNANATQTACNGFVKNQCGCMVAVNETGSAATKAYTDDVAALLSMCGVACADVVCATVTAAACVTSGSGSAGHCLGR